MQVIPQGGAPTPAPAHPLTGVTAFTMKRRVSLREQCFGLRPLGADGAEGDVLPGPLPHPFGPESRPSDGRCIT